MYKKKKDNTNRLDLVIHPVRLRIISALGNKKMTPRELAEQLPDVPQATLYRHIKRLEQGGIIDIAETHHIRGTLEKVYSLDDPAKVNFTEDDIQTLTPEDHRRYFTSFIAALLHQFSQVTEAAEKRPELLGRLGYHTNPVSLDPGDLPQFQQEFGELLKKFTEKSESKQSAQSAEFTLTTIFLPEVQHDSTN
jgi:DNA-binding transcriptional ArsR family regulator